MELQDFHVPLASPKEFYDSLNFNDYLMEFNDFHDMLYSHHENLRFQFYNFENHGNLRILRENHEN